MKRYLTYQDKKSNKFWSINAEGKSFTVTYGKIGTAGTSQTKRFESEEQCQKEAEKLVNQKLKKGYTDSTETPDTTKTNDDYSDLVNAKDLHGALCKHFAYLADSPGFENVLSAIMENAVSVHMESDKLIVDFKGDDTLEASPPADINKYKKWPESFHAIVGRHEFLSFPDSDWSILLGDIGDFELSYLEDAESELLKYVKKEEDILCPITDYSDWWLYHPKIKNPQKQNALCHFSHEGGDIDDPVTLNAGSLYLKRMAEILELEIEIPEVFEIVEDHDTLNAWWNTLDAEWKKLFKQSINIEKEPSRKQISQIVNLKEMRINEINIFDLSPVQKIKNLRELNCDESSVSDLKPLEHLVNLKYLNLVSTKIVDLEPLRNLKNLEIINISKTDVKTLEPVSNLKKLTIVYCEKTAIDNLEQLKNLTNLEKLNCNNTKIESLEPLKDLKKLKNINVSNTVINTLEPLRNLNKLHILEFENTQIKCLEPLYGKMGICISCKNTNVSFEEILKFKSANTKKGDFLGCTVYDDFFQAYDKLAEAVTGISFPLNRQLSETLGDWINDTLVKLLKSQKNEYASNVLEVYLSKFPMEISDTLKDELAGNALFVITKVNNPALEQKVIETLIPGEIKNRRLAFNLACCYASKNNREKLFYYTKAALQLGQEPNKFMEDDSCAAYKDDSEFIEICNTQQCPDPYKEPIEWWDSLDNEWKMNFGYGNSRQLETRVNEILNLEELYCTRVKSLEPLRYLLNLKKLKFEYGKFTSMEPLKYLKKLEELLLIGDLYAGTLITNIEPLRDLKNLKYLKCTCHKISDIDPLKELLNIERLVFFKNLFTSIDSLGKLIKMKELSIRSCEITDIGVIRNFINLEELDLCLTEVDSLEPLKNLYGLKKLSCSDTKITSLSPLEKLNKLEYVDISNTAINTLEPLNSLSNLKELELVGTQISNQEIKKFEKTHPKCKVLKK